MRPPGRTRSGVKSRLPFCSAAARNGSSSPRANGKSGTASAKKPISQANRLTRARAGRPENTFVTTSHVRDACRTRVAMQRWRRGLRTQQKAGPNLRSEVPRANAAAIRVRRRSRPPAITGTLTVSAICGTKAIVRICKATARLRLQSRNMPRCPPLHSLEQSRHRHHAVPTSALLLPSSPTR